MLPSSLPTMMSPYREAEFCGVLLMGAFHQMLIAPLPPSDAGSSFCKLVSPVTSWHRPGRVGEEKICRILCLNYTAVNWTNNGQALDARSTKHKWHHQGDGTAADVAKQGSDRGYRMVRTLRTPEIATPPPPVRAVSTEHHTELESCFFHHTISLGIQELTTRRGHLHL